MEISFNATSHWRVFVFSIGTGRVFFGGPAATKGRIFNAIKIRSGERALRIVSFVDWIAILIQIEICRIGAPLEFEDERNATGLLSTTRRNTRSKRCGVALGAWRLGCWSVFPQAGSVRRIEQLDRTLLSPIGKKH
jgi:hypothetical protein